MYFRVVTDRLGALAADLDSLSSNFEDVAKRRVGHQGLADSRSVDEGLHEFFGEWTDAMGRLHEQLAALAGQLHYALSAYEETDSTIRDAARGTGG